MGFRMEIRPYGRFDWEQGLRDHRIAEVGLKVFRRSRPQDDRPNISIGAGACGPQYPQGVVSEVCRSSMPQNCNSRFKIGATGKEWASGWKLGLIIILIGNRGLWSTGLYK